MRGLMVSSCLTLPSAGLSPIPSAPGASGAGSLPDLQALPESPAASFCLPVTQVPRSGRRKGSLSAGPRGSGVRASVAQTRAGWGPGRLEGRRCLLPPVVPLTATALQKQTPFWGAEEGVTRCCRVESGVWGCTIRPKMQPGAAAGLFGAE